MLILVYTHKPVSIPQLPFIRYLHNKYYVYKTPKFFQEAVIIELKKLKIPFIISILDGYHLDINTTTHSYGYEMVDYHKYDHPKYLFNNLEIVKFLESQISKYKPFELINSI